MSSEIMPASTVLDATRAWIGTPYRHQASLQHVGPIV
ncbi:hypothetical protein PFRI_24030 [Planktotalea frisia]|uniref:Uncharacterized protein n=1 Tax=Planktotalea frisia TaxID=696762 RepID=A0A1L9NVS7_9RHOB|nr:hypothetical protein PFRI_24030 [Planktotalea frisia]